MRHVYYIGCIILCQGPKGPPVGPPKNRVRRDEFHRLFDARVTPVITITPGERVLVETWDCFTNKVTGSDQTFAGIDDLLRHTGGLNPIAGPIAVAGAEPGDALAVHVEDIRLGAVAPYAVTMVVPGVGGLCGGGAPAFRADTRICPIEGDTVRFPIGRGELRLPARPMIGTIGTAPAREALESLKFGPEHCGNVDCPDLTVGSTILLPVNVPGGLLSLGDVHAAMGDGEITGIALETSADVVLRVDLVKAKDSPYVGCPQLETADIVGSIGCHFGQALDTNVRAGFADLVERLRRRYGLDVTEAYELLGAAGGVRVHQSVEGGWSAALAYVPTRVLAELDAALSPRARG